MTQLFSEGVLLIKEDKSGKSYLRLRVRDSGELLLVDIETNAEYIFQKSHLEKLVQDGRFIAGDETELKAIRKELNNQPPIELKQSVDEQKRRLKYIEGVLKANIPLGSPKRFASYLSLKSIELRDRKPPSATTLYRWVKKYVDSNEDEASLMPSYRSSGNRTPKISSDHDELINSVFNHLVSNPKTSIVYDAYLKALVDHNVFRSKEGLQQLSPVTQESIRKRLKRRSKL